MVAWRMSDLTEEMMAGPSQWSMPVDEPGGLARLRRSEDGDRALHASAAAGALALGGEVAASPSAEHEPSRHGPADEERSEVGGGGEAGLGVDAEPGALVGADLFPSPPVAERDDGDADGGGDDDPDAEPVEDRSGELVGGRSLPRQLRVAEGVGQSGERFERLGQSAVERFASGEEDGEVGGEPVASGDDEHGCGGRGDDRFEAAPVVVRAVVVHRPIAWSRSAAATLARLVASDRVRWASGSSGVSAATA